MKTTVSTISEQGDLQGYSQLFTVNYWRIFTSY